MTKKLMAIFAHPDDEGAMGGTLTHYAQQGVEIMLVCATRGEVGEISDPALATPETLGEVRQRELEAACKIYGIQHLEFLNHRDSGMVDTPENEDPRALVQADPETVIGQLVGLMRQFRPNSVVTFEPFGWYGHPDHQIMSKWATAAYPLVSDSTAYPNLGDVWHPDKFFYSVIPFSRFGGMIEKAVAAGYIEESGFGISIPREQQQKTEEAVTHIIDVAAYFEVAQAASRSHQTQFGPDSIFRKIPAEMMKEASSHEHFIQVLPEISAEASQHPQTDLFAK